MLHEINTIISIDKGKQLNDFRFVELFFVCIRHG